MNPSSCLVSKLMDQSFINNKVTEVNSVMNERIKTMRMRIKMNRLLICIALSGILATGCKKWDDHNAITDPALTKTLSEQIKEDPNLSKFSELLVKSGYDKVISSSKTITVYAPNNAALVNLDPAIVNDSAKLNVFVAN